MTRIACLNEKVWTELFLWNRDALLPEIDDLITNGVLGTEYRDVLSFVILILVLLVKPAGILGEPVSEESMVYKREF